MCIIIFTNINKNQGKLTKIPAQTYVSQPNCKRQAHTVAPPMCALIGHCWTEEPRTRAAISRIRWQSQGRSERGEGGAGDDVEGQCDFTRQRESGWEKGEWILDQEWRQETEECDCVSASGSATKPTLWIKLNNY